MTILAILNVIPPITDPMGRSWCQPRLSEIEVDETHVLMSRATFNALHEYSASYPSGVYPGKMWRRNDGAFDQRFLAAGGKPEWLLCWFGESTSPDYCSNHSRKILIVEPVMPAFDPLHPSTTKIPEGR